MQSFFRPGRKRLLEALFQQSASCQGLSRASTSFGVGCKKDVDGRDKPGHDEKSIIFSWLEAV
jgi:hypothetical protein